ncbi:unnamed protein product, partial [Citrullus colocynthis]
RHRLLFLARVVLPTPLLYLHQLWWVVRLEAARQPPTSLVFTSAGTAGRVPRQLNSRLPLASRALPPSPTAISLPSHQIRRFSWVCGKEIGLLVDFS